MKDGNEPEPLTLGQWAACLAFTGLVILFASLQHRFGGYWWFGCVVLGAGLAMGFACYVIVTRGFYKIGVAVESGVCSVCEKPLSALETPSTRWRFCPHCGNQVENLNAPPQGLSKYLLWCKWALLGLCVLFAPLVVVTGMVLEPALRGLLGGPYGMREHLPQDLLFGGLGTLAYCFLAVAAWQFGRAGVLGRNRVLHTASAVGALLLFVLLAGVVVFLFTQSERNLLPPAFRR